MAGTSSLGVLEGVQEITVSAEVQGLAVGRAVHEGQIVKQGDTLCDIDPTFHKLSLEQAEAELKKAEAVLSNAEAVLGNLLQWPAGNVVRPEQTAASSSSPPTKPRCPRTRRSPRL